MTTRRRKRHSPEQIIAKLRDADAMLNAGKDLAVVLQTLETSESTYERWLEQVGVGTLYIEPGSPWENGYAESFHSRLRDEFLALEVFENLPAARKLTALWRDDYNHHRLHSSLGYVTPAQFAARCAAVASASATPQPALQQHSGLTQPIPS